MDLDDDARADLAWWIKYALSDAYAGVSLIVDLDPITLRSLAVFFYTDSSGVCCAGGWGNRWFCHAFGVEQMAWHISVKELFSAVAVCLTFGAELRGRIVVIDSTRGNWRGRLPCWLAEFAPYPSLSPALAPVLPSPPLPLTSLQAWTS